MLLVIGVGYVVGCALDWGSEQAAVIMGDFGLSAASAAAAVSCFLYARSRPDRFRPAWLLFSLSSAMAALGNATWGWYEVVLKRPVPTPSCADAFFLCVAPLATVGLLVLAKRPVTKTGWVCLALDTWLIGGSMLTLAWGLALVQVAKSEGPGAVHTALSLCYPLLDIAMVSMVFVLHFQRSAEKRSAVNMAIGSLALTVMCDALFTSPLLHDSHHSGQLLEAGWFAASLLLAYAPWVAPRQGQPDAGGYNTDGQTLVVPGHTPQRHGLHHQHSAQDADHNPHMDARPITGPLAVLTPYLAAAVCTMGIVCNVLNDNRVDRVGLLAGGTVVFTLLVRQGITLLDNINLTQELAAKENHFRSLVQGSSDVIMIAAPSGILRYVSPAATSVYGRSADELVGTELAGLIHPEDLGRVVHDVRRFLAASPLDAPSTRIECRFRSGDGNWLNVESAITRHGGGLIFNSRDVTERVRLRDQLRRVADAAYGSPASSADTDVGSHSDSLAAEARDEAEQSSRASDVEPVREDSSTQRGIGRGFSSWWRRRTEGKRASSGALLQFTAQFLALLLPEHERRGWTEEQRGYLADLAQSGRLAQWDWILRQLIAMPHYAYTVRTSRDKESA
ncbi:MULTISPECIES: PAS domain-containing protein [Streptomyces]|uniref:PAS domain-containing protein n=1 Tax=Streptomyces herbicida TaxID=3065675 RepID=UPI0038CD2328